MNVQEFIEHCKKCQRRSKCHFKGCILDHPEEDQMSKLKNVPVIAFGSQCFYVITDSAVRKYRILKYSK